MNAGQLRTLSAKATLTILFSLALAACSGQVEPTPSPSPSEPIETVSPEQTTEAPEETESPPAEEPPLTPQEQTSACLLGIWEIDQESDLWQLWAEDADEISGRFFVMFDPDNNFVVDYQQVTVHKVLSEDPQHEMEIIWDGVSTGRYEVDEEGSVAVEIVDFGATRTMIDTTEEDVQETIASIGEPFPANYECDDERLIATPASEGEGRATAEYDIFERNFGDPSESVTVS